jgi:hypothetical protein
MAFRGSVVRLGNDTQDAPRGVIRSRQLFHWIAPIGSGAAPILKVGASLTPRRTSDSGEANSADRGGSGRYV